MHFCNKCGNMYYLKVGGDTSTEDSNKLIYYCRNCGNEDATFDVDNICVSKTQLKRGEQKYNNIINEYTKLDPTLPRISNVPCPNTECPSNKGLGDGEGEGEGSGEGGRKKSEVVYLRYDDINMKYIYLCAHCDTVWRTDEHAQ